MDHHIDISFSAAYSTLNELTDATKSIWIVCHGYGQLATHFIKKFEGLDSKRNYILAPQGLSKFYLTDHKRVGASWMTKEDRNTDLENQKRYFDDLFSLVFTDTRLENYKINLLGFSQGVSMISRLATYKKIPFDNMILWAGGFPRELNRSDFGFIKPDAKLKIVLGKKDQFYKMPDFMEEIEMAQSAVDLNAKIISFDGAHNIEKSVLEKLDV